jgi:hypothetical protein
MQCTAYAEMFGELAGQSIEQIVVLIGTEEGPGQVFVESKQNYLNPLKEYISNHYLKNS